MMCREIKSAYDVIVSELNFLSSDDQHDLSSYDRPFLMNDPSFPSLPTISNETTITTTTKKSQRELDDELLAEEESLLAQRAEMIRNGQWSTLSTKKSAEPARNKTNWDHLLEEMQWLSKDFATEKKQKMDLAKKIAKSASKHISTLATKEKKRKKDEEHSLKKHAANVAKLVRTSFWNKLEKIVQIRNQTKVDLKKHEFLQRKQDLLVEKSERLAQFLSQDLVTPSTPMPAQQTVIFEEVEDLQENNVASDSMSLELLGDATEEEESTATVQEGVEDFVPEDMDDDDDIPSEDEDEDEDYSDEISALQKEMDIPVDELLKSNYSTPDDAASDLEERKKISEASASAEQFQPTGFTLSTTRVQTKIPELFNQEHPLREYQIIGLDWLVTMHDRSLNGILADEMGLGKTIQTIALLAHLASEQGIWGPHLVVVPASVLLNWEIEFKRWCPSLKILAYYGTQKQRQQKRKGWNKPDTFHVCITSYNLVVQDKNILKKKKWHYLILDEAHYIKNLKSQYWQTLLNFNTHSRLLLTGTPLQNSVMELWSLMHFLMPQIFQSHSEFKEWFANPVSGMVEGTQEVNKQLISRLHAILRPFILRRLKRDVAKQLPQKHEHVIKCKLSKRQRFLYEDFMSKAETRTNLISGNFFKIINVLMQLRKVCNHPDLFETRPIISPFEIPRISIYIPELITNLQHSNPLSTVNLSDLGAKFITTELLSSFEVDSMKEKQASKFQFTEFVSQLNRLDSTDVTQSGYPPVFMQYQKRLEEYRGAEREKRYKHFAYLNSYRCDPNTIITRNAVRICSIPSLKESILHSPIIDGYYCQALAACVKTPEQRAEEFEPIIERFVAIIPKTRAKSPIVLRHNELPYLQNERNNMEGSIVEIVTPRLSVFHQTQVRTQVYFPDKRLLEFDCGKLQVMFRLLRDLKANGHRVLIFTQMSQMLNILEAFLSMHNYSYFRLDGATKLEQRQYLMETFNKDDKIFAFILSTRSGGLGINLTGADTVIFYDSDWNPAMDAQAQDRCHRIGQTREVNIYRLISESTVEERILMKANQKRKMNDMVIHNGGFTPDLLQKLDVREFFDNQPFLLEQPQEISLEPQPQEEITEKDLERMLASAEDENDVIGMYCRIVVV
jgi:SNF2 family DNA or RNA helicase